MDGVGSLTFLDWQTRSDTLARGLIGRGLQRGDRVGLLFGGSGWIDFAVAYCGVHKAGGVAVPLSDRLPAAELAYTLADSAASCLIHEERLGPDWTGGWTATVDQIDGGPDQIGGGPDQIGGSPDQAIEGPRPDDLAQILYTSGTTGRPKGVAATHANLTWGRGGRRRPFAHSGHLAHAFPIGTNAGQLMLVNALDAHPTVVTLPHFTPARFARLIEDYRAGTVFVVPAMAMELLRESVQDRHDLSGVLLLGSAAAPLPGAVAERLAVAFPNATIVNYYTSTEAAPAQTVMMYDSARPDSVGRAVGGGEIRIASEAGQPLPAGEIGEVWLRSAARPRAYFGDADASGKVFVDGWVRMGDLGHLDADGYLHLADRESDVVKSGAFKVSTLHVEEAVHQHGHVVEAAVVGVPHPVLGKQLAAVIVLRAPLPPEELRVFLKERLAAHEMPARFLEVESLPRNLGGKVDKRALRRRLG